MRQNRPSVRPSSWAFQVGQRNMSRESLLLAWRHRMTPPGTDPQRFFYHEGMTPPVSQEEARKGRTGREILTLRELLKLAHVGAQREQMKAAHRKATP